MKQPIQPIVVVNDVFRFRENAIVRFLLEMGGFDLNDLAKMDFSQEDREQFAMLIGYSLRGFGELSYVSDETYAAAAAMADGAESDKDARIMALQETLNSVRRGMRAPIAELFGMHPDDLEFGHD